MTRWTTPSIRYKFDRVNVNNIVSCVLRIEQGETAVEKSFADATVGEKMLIFTLTQEETSQFNEGKTAEIQLRYKLSGGEVGASKITKVQVDRVLKEGSL